MNQEEQIKVERIKERIMRKSRKVPFEYTAVGRVLTSDPVDLLLGKSANYCYRKKHEKEIKKLIEEGYKGAPDDYEAILNYEQSIKSMPIHSYQDEEGVWYHTYPDGNQVKVRVTLTSIFPSGEVGEVVFRRIREDNLQKVEERKKQLYSKCTGIDPEIIKTMSWDEIDEVILEQSRLSSKLRRVLVPQRKNGRG